MVGSGSDGGSARARLSTAALELPRSRLHSSGLQARVLSGKADGVPTCAATHSFAWAPTAATKKKGQTPNHVLFSHRFVPTFPG